ncbi:MAG: sugar phosphate isomerase/epimerase family protein [Gemmatimonadaceae bacterium]
MSSDPLPRRDFLALAALGLTGCAIGASRSARSSPPPAGSPTALPAIPSPAVARRETLKLGVASYSLRNFPRDRAIAMVKALHTPWVNLKSFHLPYELSAAEIAAARREVEGAGLTIVGGGTITFDTDTDAGVARYFDYARAAGMPLIVATMDPAILPRVERFAKQYDIRVAIHNHGPEDKHFPSPYDVLNAVKGMDARLGLCMDIGHTVRTGTDVVRAAADAGPRLLDMHAKDLRDLHDVESQCVVGEGAIPIAALFRQLIAMSYQGYVNLEYEIEPDDPLPGMQRSFAYMRGVLAGIAG